MKQESVPAFLVPVFLKKDDMECMKEDVVARLHELTDVDFEHDSAGVEQVQLRSLLT